MAIDDSRKRIRLLAVKKLCLKLCGYLPPNYKDTIQKLRNLTYLSKEDVILILNPTEGQPIDPMVVNQRITMRLLMNCQSHTDLLAVCSVLEELVEPIEQRSVHDLHRELTRDMEEEKKKQKEKEQDIDVVVSQQGSTNAGEKSPQSSSVDDIEVFTITATTPTTVVTAAISTTASAAGSSVSRGAEATASVVDNPTPQEIDYGGSDLEKQLLTNNEEFDSLDKIDDATFSKVVEKLRVGEKVTHLTGVCRLTQPSFDPTLLQDVPMSLDSSAPSSTPHSYDNTNEVIATGPAVQEQTDPSEVVVKKPMPLHIEIDYGGSDLEKQLLTNNEDENFGREKQRKAMGVCEESMRARIENDEYLQACMFSVAANMPAHVIDQEAMQSVLSQRIEERMGGNKAMLRKRNRVSSLSPSIEESMKEFKVLLGSNKKSDCVLDEALEAGIEFRRILDNPLIYSKISKERAIQQWFHAYKFKELQELKKKLHEVSKKVESGKASRWVWISSLSERRGAVAVDIVGALSTKEIKSSSLSYKKPSEGSIEIVVVGILEGVESSVSGEVPTLQSIYAGKVAIELPLYQGHSSNIEVVVYEAIKQVARELPLYQGHSSNIEAVLYEATVHLPEANTTSSYTITASLYWRYSSGIGNYVTGVADKVFTLTGRLEVESQHKELFEGSMSRHYSLLHSNSNAYLI